jgi:hypothetical protein
MPAFKVPSQQSTGVLILDPLGAGADLTCHLRIGAIVDDGGQDLDLGTFCDPTASVRTAGRVNFEAEWLNSFSDGTDDGLYDDLLPFAGTTVAVEFQPYGPGTDKPKFAFETYIPYDPIGSFQADNPVIVNTVWGVTNLVYTKAVAV